MNIVNQLASSLNRRDETPNLELAQRIAAEDSHIAVQELITLLNAGSRDIQSDSIKVLYEIGNIKPMLISSSANVFLELLSHKNNRLQWGAMTALNSITDENPKAVYEGLEKIISAAESGSVITLDHCVNILIKLCRQAKYQKDAYALLMERILCSPSNQLPTYAEQALQIVNNKTMAGALLKILQNRVADVEKDSKRKRIEKVIKKLING